jgi:hypothetical protein
MTSQVVIYERNGWKLTSYGNGWAYVLENTVDDTSLWVQDDDAGAFRDAVMTPEGWLVEKCEERFGDYSEVMVANNHE